MRAVLLALPLALVGCGDPLYYQTRSVPEGGSSHGFISSLFQREDAEVYELPARPPAIDRGDEDTHLSRDECRRPGQPFKPTPLVGVEDEAQTVPGQPDQVVVARMDDQPESPRSTTPAPLQPMAGWREPVEVGARERIGVAPVGSCDTRPIPQPASGITTTPPRPLAAWGDDDRWCPTPAP